MYTRYYFFMFESLPILKDLGASSLAIQMRPNGGAPRARWLAALSLLAVRNRVCWAESPMTLCRGGLAEHVLSLSPATKGQWMSPEADMVLSWERHPTMEFVSVSLSVTADSWIGLGISPEGMMGSGARLNGSSTPAMVVSWASGGILGGPQGALYGLDGYTADGVVRKPESAQPPPESVTMSRQASTPFYPTLPDPTPPYPALPHPTPFYPTLPHSTPFYPTLPHSTPP